MADDATVSHTDVRRVVKGVGDGKSRAQVSPSWARSRQALPARVSRSRSAFVKKGGLWVQLVSDAGQDVAAIRDVDLQKKYHRSATDLAKAVRLTLPEVVGASSTPRDRRGLGVRPHVCV